MEVPIQYPVISTNMSYMGSGARPPGHVPDLYIMYIL